MAMQQCPNGHLYDDSKNSSCPFCNGATPMNGTVPLSDGAAGGNMFPATTALDGSAAYVPPAVPVTPNYVATDAVAAQEVFPETQPIGTEFQVTQYADDVVNESGIREVRGWLVCIDGAKRGLDFKIGGEKNHIGRGDGNDIKIDFDNTISKGVNAIISYDVRNNKFFIFLGESKNNIYVNDQMLMTPLELKDYDIIEIGKTKLVFRSLCNDQFNWEKADKEEK